MNEDGRQTQAPHDVGADRARARSGASWHVVLVILGAALGVVIAMAQSGAGRRGAVVIVVIFAVVALFTVLLVEGISAEQRRRQEREQAKAALAREHGVTIRKTDDGAIKHRLRRLPEIKGGGKIKNVIEGELDGRLMYGFEHVHVVHTGNATIPVHRTIFAMETPQWPRVDIKRKGALGAALRRLLGRPDLRFDLPEFNRRMRVITSDASFAITLLSPELQEHILKKPSVVWRLLDGWLCLIHSGPMRFDRAPDSLARLESFWKLIPPELEYWQAPREP